MGGRAKTRIDRLIHAKKWALLSGPGVLDSRSMEVGASKRRIGRLGRIAIPGVVGACLLALSFAPAGASAKSGFIVVQKRITLNFPSAGVYEGKIELRAKGKRLARQGGRKAGRKDRKSALNRARNICEDYADGSSVKVLHLSKPPFLIGADAPGVDAQYSVNGPAPPTGDSVKAFQLGFRKVFVTNATRKASLRYRWVVRCNGAKVIKPYPF